MKVKVTTKRNKLAQTGTQMIIGYRPYTINFHIFGHKVKSDLITNMIKDINILRWEQINYFVKVTFSLFMS